MTIANIIDAKSWAGVLAATTLVKFNLIVSWLQPIALVVPLAYTVWKWRSEYFKEKERKAKNSLD